jgi:hypothetical protein
VGRFWYIRNAGKRNMGHDEEEARMKKQRKLRQNFSPDTGGMWVMRFIVDLLTPENNLNNRTW